MIDAPSGAFGTGKSRDTLLATQTLALRIERERADNEPRVKAIDLRGIVRAGNRTTVSDCELLTQTRFCGSMTMSKGELKSFTLTILPSLMRPPGKNRQLIVQPSATRRSFFYRHRRAWDFQNLKSRLEAVPNCDVHRRDPE